MTRLHLACNSVLEFFGLTVAARKVLRDHPLVINYFPFRIGRLSRRDLDTSARQDFLIPDEQPYHVSRSHLIIDTEGDCIRITDDESTCGTVVNDILIGAKVARESSLVLSRGIHTLRIGGPKSPYSFQLALRQVQVSDYAPSKDLPDRFPQAYMLYSELCRGTFQMLSDTAKTAAQRALTAESLAKSIISRQDLLDALRFLSSNPQTKGDFTARHSVNVAITSAVLFSHLNYSSQDIVKIVAASLLHDIGMFGIDRRVLLKRESLTPQEFASIQMHTMRGAGLLSSPEEICTVASALARDHHERADGSGYPHKRRNLHDISCFFGLLDTYEAVTHDRPYRKAMTLPNAVRMLAATTSFDPEARKAFLRTFSFYPVSSMVQLNSGEIGQVIRTVEDKPLSPEVRILLDANGAPAQKPYVVDLNCEPRLSIVSGVDSAQRLQNQWS